MAPYPSPSEISQLCSHLSTDNFQPFYDCVDPNVTWDVLGSTGASGHFTTLEEWQKGALETAGHVLTAPLKFKLVHLTGGGEQAWTAVELEALDAVGKNGKPITAFLPPLLSRCSRSSS